MPEDRIIEAIDRNCFGDSTMPIYCGACNLSSTSDPKTIACHIMWAISGAKFLRPEVPAEEVAKNFCSLLLVDPMLYETFLGIRFSYFNNISNSDLIAFVREYSKE